jgi:CheY-like chemotaxis protein
MPRLDWATLRTEPARDRLSIILVDDDALVREATAWILRDAGHTVTEARDGFEALSILEQQGPVDLVVSDVSMPQMSGLELSQAVKRVWPSLPVLLISGRTQAPGAHSFIMKPFKAETLLRTAAALVQRPPDPSFDATGNAI